jgi:hypothetical protein
MTAGERVLLAALCLAVSARAVAADAPPAPDRIALGLEVDLLPTALSAVDGHMGGGANVWAGHDRVRLRAVGSRIYFPPGVLTPTGFRHRELTVGAGIVDYFFMPGWQGPWVGAGLERWWNTIGSASGPASASSNSWALTLGGGLAWKVWGNLYLNPWAAAHVMLSRPDLTLQGKTWSPAALSAEASLKLGWHL